MESQTKTADIMLAERKEVLYQEVYNKAKEMEGVENVAVPKEKKDYEFIFDVNSAACRWVLRRGSINQVKINCKIHKDGMTEAAAKLEGKRTKQNFENIVFHYSKIDGSLTFVLNTKITMETSSEELCEILVSFVNAMKVTISRILSASPENEPQVDAGEIKVDGTNDIKSPEPAEKDHTDTGEPAERKSEKTKRFRSGNKTDKSNKEEPVFSNDDASSSKTEKIKDVMDEIDELFSDIDDDVNEHFLDAEEVTVNKNTVNGNAEEAFDKLYQKFGITSSQQVTAIVRDMLPQTEEQGSLSAYPAEKQLHPAALATSDEMSMNITPQKQLEQAFATKKRHLDKKEAALMQKEKSLDEKVSDIRKREEQLNQKESIRQQEEKKVEEHKKDLLLKEKRITAMLEELEQRRIRVEQAETVIEIKTKEADTREQEASQKKKAYENKMETLRCYEEEVRKKEEQDSNRALDLDKREKELLIREELLKTQKDNLKYSLEELAEKEHALEEKDALSPDIVSQLSAERKKQEEVTVLLSEQMQQNEKLQKQTDRYKTKLFDAKDKMLEFNERYKALQEELAKTKESILGKEQEVSRREAQADEQSRKEIKRLRGENEKLASEIENRRQTEAELRKQLENRDALEKEGDNSSKSSKEETENLRRELDETKQKLSASEAENTELHNKIVLLEQKTEPNYMVLSVKEELMNMGITCEVVPSEGPIVLKVERDGCVLYINEEQKNIYAEKTVKSPGKYKSAVEQLNQEDNLGMYRIGNKKIEVKKFLLDVSKDVADIVENLRKFN